MKKSSIARIQQSGMRNGMHIDIIVNYVNNRVGGYINTAKPSGFYLEAKPITPNGVSVATVPQADKSMLLFEASRFSEKQMEKAVLIGLKAMPDLIQELLISQLSEYDTKLRRRK